MLRFGGLLRPDFIGPCNYYGHWEDCLPAGRKDELRKTPACRLAGKTNYGFEGDQGL